MIGKIIGGAIGAKAAAHSARVGGAGGALLGVAGATLLKRLSLPALIALGVGGYAFKKWSEKDAQPAPKAKRTAPKRKPRKAPAKTAAAAA